jgi:hypothetical protein
MWLVSLLFEHAGVAYLNPQAKVGCQVLQRHSLALLDEVHKGPKHALYTHTCSTYHHHLACNALAHKFHEKEFLSALRCSADAKTFHLPLLLIICFLPLLLHTDLAHPLRGLSLLFGIPSCSCSCQLSFLSSFCSFPLCIFLPSSLLVCLDRT